MRVEPIKTIIHTEIITVFTVTECHFHASASLQMQKDEETINQRMNKNNSNRYS